MQQALKAKAQFWGDIGFMGTARQLENIKHCLFHAFSDRALAPRVGGVT